MKKDPLPYSTNANVLADFAQCIELVDNIFGEDARTLSLKGHQMEVGFGIYVRRVSSIGAEAEGSDYTFKWTPHHQRLCADLTQALAHEFMKDSIHRLGFKMESYGQWSVGRAKNKKQEIRDNYEITVDELQKRRIAWFKNFIKQDDIYDIELRYPSMPRPYGPFWPANRFGYLIGRAHSHIWIMSHGLSNPVISNNEPNWETNYGHGCEVLVRCDPEAIDLTDNLMTIISSPEVIILDTLCATLIEMANPDNDIKGIDIVSATQIVELNYYKHTPIHPLPPGTKFALTNASSFDISRKIPCLGPYSARPLIATFVPQSLEDKEPDEISRALIADKSIGVLPEFSGGVDIGL